MLYAIGILINVSQFSMCWVPNWEALVTDYEYLNRTLTDDSFPKVSLEVSLRRRVWIFSWETSKLILVTELPLSTCQEWDNVGKSRGGIMVNDKGWKIGAQKGYF